MTTICTDGKSIAADSQQESEFIHPVSVQKIFSIEDGYIGAAGDCGASDAVIKWIVSGGEKPSVTGDFDILILRKSGVTGMGTDLVEFAVGKHYAIGSGSCFAMAAMMCGMSPTQAVKIAAKLDPYTGGKIVTKRLNSGRS